MSNTDTINEIESNIKKAKEIVNLGAALERLKINRDFKLVFGTGYFRDEAIRLVHLKADPQFQSKERQEAIIKQMDSIGSLDSYLYAVSHAAAIAQKAIESDEEMRDELLAEELNNG